MLVMLVSGTGGSVQAHSCKSLMLLHDECDALGVTGLIKGAIAVLSNLTSLYDLPGHPVWCCHTLAQA